MSHNILFNMYEALLICFMLVIKGLAITYFVFGILFLVQDFDSWKECKEESALWPYVLVALILEMTSVAEKQQEETNGISTVTLFMLNLGIMIWGSLEVFQRTCDDLQDSNLWVFALVTFILQALGVLLVLMFFCIFMVTKK